MNILVKSKHVALLGDFGLVKKDGVTPIYCAPEQLSASVVEATDTHGLGITILFSFFEHDSAIRLLFAGYKDFQSSTDCEPHSIEVMIQDPVVQLVKSMISSKPQHRISLEIAKTIIMGLKAFPTRKNMQQFKLTCLNKYYTSRNTLNLSLNTNSLCFGKLSSHTKVSTETVNFKKISSECRNQKDSYFCWAFTLSTLIKHELKRLVMTLGLTENIIDETKMKELLKLVNKLNENEQLLKELVCLVIPRKLKFSSITHSKGLGQTASVVGALEKLCNESVIKDAGWKRLPSINIITEQLPGKCTVIMHILFVI